MPLKRLIAEFIGTFALVFAGTGAIIINDLSGGVITRVDREIETVITVCGHLDQTCPIFPGQVNRHHWAFDDPAKAEGTEELQLESFGPSGTKSSVCSRLTRREDATARDPRFRFAALKPERHEMVFSLDPGPHPWGEKCAASIVRSRLPPLTK
jgi:hypothetical protein